MPVYEYQCDECGVFEVNRRITEPPLKKCPTCKGKVQKLISQTSFHLKGGGWYATDYAGKNACGKNGGSDAKAKDDNPAAAPAAEAAKPDKAKAECPAKAKCGDACTAGS